VSEVAAMSTVLAVQAQEIEVGLVADYSSERMQLEIVENLENKYKIFV